MTRIYFNLLADQEIEAIIRHVSERPHRPDWESYVDPDDFNLLLSIEGCFQNIAEHMFTRVQFCSHKLDFSAQHSGKYTWFSKPKHFSEASKIGYARCNMRTLPLFKSCTRHLRMHCLSCLGSVNMAQVAQVLKSFQKIISVDLTGLSDTLALSTIIINLPRCNRSLTLYDPKNLSTEAIEVLKSSGIKEFRLLKGGKDLRAKREFWCALSDAQSVTLYNPSPVDLLHLTKHCLYLSDVSLCDVALKKPEEVDEVIQYITKLCHRLGRRLRSLEVEPNILPEDLLEILSKNPDLRISAIAREEVDKAIDFCCEHLVFLRCSVRNLYDEKLHECLNLKSLEVCGPAIDLDAFLAEIFPIAENVRSLSMRVTEGAFDSFQMIVDLHEFSFTADKLPGDELSVIGRNCPELKMANFMVQGGKALELEFGRIQGVIDCFFECPDFVALDISQWGRNYGPEPSFVTELSEYCTLFRILRTHIAVLGVVIIP